jgi:hypothetical protein
MKTNIKKFSLLTLLVYFTAGCGTFYDINTDPNNPSTSSESVTFPAGVSSAAYVFGGVNYQVLGCFWSQYWTQATDASQYGQIDRYNMQSDAMDGRAYQELYNGALNDLEYVSRLSASKRNWQYYLMAEVMKAYIYQMLADLYDKVPYREALRGAEGILTPKFDDGQVIYDSLISKIDQALAKDFTLSTVIKPKTDDLLYNGDLNSWIRFANTLKLKIYIRQSLKRPEVARAGIQKMYTAGAQFLVSNAAMTQFNTEQNRRNPFYETQIAAGTGRRGYVDVVASNTMLNLLTNNNDPRRNALYNPSQIGALYRGLDQGDYTSNTAPKGYRNFAQPNIQATTPVYFMTNSESYLLQAEAIKRFPAETGKSDADAKALYEQAINAHCSMLGVSSAGLYGSGNPYEYKGTDADKLDAIAIQKWIALCNIEGLESFFETNRTRAAERLVPLTASKENNTNNVFPRRLLFPLSERQRNPNTPAEVPITTKVWWDVN